MIAGYLQQVFDTLVEAREAALPTEEATAETVAEFAAALLQASAVPTEPRGGLPGDTATVGEARPASSDGSSVGRSPEPSLPPQLPARDIPAGAGTEVAAPEPRSQVATVSPTPAEPRATTVPPNPEVPQKNDLPAEPAPARTLPAVEGRELPPPISLETLRLEPSRSPAPERRVERSRPELAMELPTSTQSVRRTAVEAPPLREEPESPALHLSEKREGAPAPLTPVERSWTPERSPVAPLSQTLPLESVSSARNPAPLLPPEGASRIVQDVSWLASRGGGQARVRLHPPELGEIELAVRVRNQDVEITIRAHDSRALVALTEGKELLLEGLAGRDLRPAHVQITRGGADESPAARDGDSRGWNDASGDRPGSDRGQHDAESRSRLPRAFGEARPADVPMNRRAGQIDERAPSRGAVDIRI